MEYTKTSETHPIRVDPIANEDLGLPGWLGMTFCLGKKAAGTDGVWDRDLEEDLRRLADGYNMYMLVSLMEGHEYESLSVSTLVDRTREHGVRVLTLPIVDGGAPNGPEAERLFDELVLRVVRTLARGKVVVVHCKGGLGRTGLLATCVLVTLGHGAAAATGKVREARSPGAVELGRHEDYVSRYEARLEGE